MKTSLLIIIGIVIILVGTLTVVFSQQTEIECLRLYKDIQELSRIGGIALAERETIDLHKSLVFEYVEKNCPDFSDLEFIYNNYKQNTPEPEHETDPILIKAVSLGINNIRDAIDSNDFSYDEKVEYIQFRFEQNPDTIPSLNLRIKDLTRELEDGERPKFTLIESGYANPCTSPKLEVYLIKGERGLYSFSDDEPIFESRIVYPCPEFEKYSPILNYWTEQDFPRFPACIYEGIHVIVVDSGTERHALEEYYCNSSRQFEPPKTFEVIIPKGSSDPEIKNNFAPFELELRYGDHLKIINQDDSMHQVILFVDKQEGSAVFTIRVNPDESFIEPVYHLGTFELASWDENENEHAWMHGVITVKEN